MLKKCPGCECTFEAGSGKRGASRKFCCRGCRNRVHKNERPLADRFWEKVDQSGGPNACWPWTASTDTFGYGRVWTGERIDGSNRVAWELTNGKLSEGECALHACDNPPCCNPSHLFVGTKGDNCTDMTIKGRHGMAKLTKDDVLSIRAMYKTGRFKQDELAKRFGISDAMVSMITTRRNWKHV